MPTKPAAPVTRPLDNVQAAPTRQVKVGNPAPAAAVPTSGFGGKYQHVGTAPSAPETSAINVNPSLPGAVGVDTVNARVPNAKALTREGDDNDDENDKDDTPIIS